MGSLRSRNSLILLRLSLASNTLPQRTRPRPADQTTIHLGHAPPPPRLGRTDQTMTIPELHPVKARRSGQSLSTPDNEQVPLVPRHHTMPSTTNLDYGHHPLVLRATVPSTIKTRHQEQGKFKCHNVKPSVLLPAWRQHTNQDMISRDHDLHPPLVNCPSQKQSTG